MFSLRWPHALYSWARSEKTKSLPVFRDRAVRPIKSRGVRRNALLGCGPIRPECPAVSEYPGEVEPAGESPRRSAREASRGIANRISGGAWSTELAW